jgi:hypothetical protein
MPYAPLSTAPLDLSGMPQLLRHLGHIEGWLFALVLVILALTMVIAFDAEGRAKARKRDREELASRLDAVMPSRLADRRVRHQPPPDYDRRGVEVTLNGRPTRLPRVKLTVYDFMRAAGLTCICCLTPCKDAWAVVTYPEEGLPPLEMRGNDTVLLRPGMVVNVTATTPGERV